MDQNDRTESALYQIDWVYQNLLVDWNEWAWTNLDPNNWCKRDGRPPQNNVLGRLFLGMDALCLMFMDIRNWR